MTKSAEDSSNASGLFLGKQAFYFPLMMSHLCQQPCLKSRSKRDLPRWTNLKSRLSRGWKTLAACGLRIHQPLPQVGPSFLTNSLFLKLKVGVNSKTLLCSVFVDCLVLVTSTRVLHCDPRVVWIVPGKYWQTFCWLLHRLRELAPSKVTTSHNLCPYEEFLAYFRR